MIWIHALHSSPQLSWWMDEWLVLGYMEQFFLFLRASNFKQHWSVVWAFPSILSFFLSSQIATGTILCVEIVLLPPHANRSLAFLEKIREKDFCFFILFLTPQKSSSLEILIWPFWLLVPNGKELCLLDCNICSAKKLLENRSLNFVTILIWKSKQKACEGEENQESHLFSWLSSLFWLYNITHQVVLFHNPQVVGNGIMACRKMCQKHQAQMVLQYHQTLSNQSPILLSPWKLKSCKGVRLHVALWVSMLWTVFVASFFKQRKRMGTPGEDSAHPTTNGS